MPSLVPVLLEKMRQEEMDKQILRQGIMAEYDAINMYGQLAAMSNDSGIKKVFSDISKEEKTHAGEFQAMLLRFDKEQEEELKNGEKEIIDLLRNRYS